MFDKLPLRLSFGFLDIICNCISISSFDLTYYLYRYTIFVHTFACCKLQESLRNPSKNVFSAHIFPIDLETRQEKTAWRSTLTSFAGHFLYGKMVIQTAQNICV